eukprot:COSAG06_NODE_10592_length_1652_cov_1.389569_1_plen_128_part_00
MERIGPLGAVSSTDRWNQVSVDPIEGPLPEHVGAEQPGAVSWASAADRQRARSFSARASFGQGTSPGLARWIESLSGTTRVGGTLESAFHTSTFHSGHSGHSALQILGQIATVDLGRAHQVVTRCGV